MLLRCATLALVFFGRSGYDKLLFFLFAHSFDGRLRHVTCDCWHNHRSMIVLYCVAIVVDRCFEMCRTRRRTTNERATINVVCLCDHDFCCSDAPLFVGRNRRGKGRGGAAAGEGGATTSDKATAEGKTVSPVLCGGEWPRASFVLRHKKISMVATNLCSLCVGTWRPCIQA
jgi:hypothetical protein